MPPNLDGLVSAEYASNLLSSNLRLITEMQTHLWRIQELAVSISDPNKQRNAVSTLNSSAGTRTVHRGVGPLSVAFSSTIDDMGSSYISEISVIGNRSGWHERGDIFKDTPSSRLSFSPPHRQCLTPSHTVQSSFLRISNSRSPIPRSYWSQSTDGQLFSPNEVIMGDVDTYFNDVDEFYLLVAASEAARAKRRRNLEQIAPISDFLLDDVRSEVASPARGRTLSNNVETWVDPVNPKTTSSLRKERRRKRTRPESSGQY